MHTIISQGNDVDLAPAYKRVDDRLRGYWESLLKGRSYPSETDINPEDIDDIWDSCFLVKVTPVDAERGYRYTYLGIKLIEAFGDDLTNQEVSARLVDPTSAPLVKSFEQVTKTGIPIKDDAEFTNKNGMVIKYRSCILPLGAKSNRVDYVIGAMKWKAY